MNKWYIKSSSLLNYIFDAVKKVLLEKPAMEYVLILETAKKYRSTAISTHFQSHVTTIWKELSKHGISVSREKIYFQVLLLACEMGTVEGAAEYPYELIERTSKFGNKAMILFPLRTSVCTNKQMMQAVEAAHRFAANIQEYYNMDTGIILPEKEEW